MCNWFSKLFGCKCCCKKGEACCHKDGAPANPTPMNNEAKPDNPQEGNAEKPQ
ncbi:MAG: hypothetical protein WC523_02160 [Patescibacteria group bacterium]|jgi:hypothetical protein